VIIILGILLAIALPSYLSFRLRANKSAAQANVSAAVPGLEAYNADNTTGIGYEGASLAKLQSIDAGIKNVSVVLATSHAYCIKSTKPTTPVYHKSGPAGDIKVNGC
jgi:Tfp pilus assembly protein PilE